MSKQLSLFQNEAAAKRWIMISLRPEYYEQVISGSKKYEYRKNTFVRVPVNAFIYVTSTVMEVSCCVSLGEPIIGLPDEIAKIKESEVAGSYQMMMDWLVGCETATALPIEEVNPFAPVALSELRRAIPEFQPPQGLIYLDKYPELLDFLKGKAQDRD